MRLRNARSGLFVLLLASVASLTVAVATDSEAALSQVRPDVGTKDAPVDGKDGKPHRGPFVNTERNRESPNTDAADASSKDRSPLKVQAADGKQLPEVNDGVMDDKNRALPKIGTTGTEGGVSEKEKQRKAKESKTGEKEEKKPEMPKEAPPLPHSEMQKIQGDKGSKDKDGKDIKQPKDGNVAGFEKPLNLPIKPDDTPHPLPDSANKDHLGVSTTKGTVLDSGSDDPTTSAAIDGEGLIQPFHSFVLSLTMILISEVGDKTFLVAALMAMKYDRMVVFSAAFGALLVMTVLSAVLGHTVPALISKRLTNLAAAVLFVAFGVKLLREGLVMSREEDVSAELHEVERELAEKEQETTLRGRRRGSSRFSSSALEMGLGGISTMDGRKARAFGRLPSPPRSPSESPTTSPARSPIARRSIRGRLQGLGNLMMLLLSPAWVQTFAMTFFSEWGDRSQIATIAMAAGQDYLWVTCGAVLGHGICTGVAVIGGRAIAGRVSLKVVTVGGAVAFLLFGALYFAEALFYA